MPLWEFTSALATGHTAASDQHVTVPGNGISISTESRTRLQVQAAYTLSNMLVIVRANASPVAMNYQARINAVSGNQTIPVAAFTTGTFEDAVNTDALVAGDDLNVETNETVAGMNITTSAFSFLVDGTVTPPMACSSGAAPSIGRGVTFLGLTGRLGTGTEATRQYRISAATTGQFIGLRLISNSYDDVLVVTLRQNGADTALDVSVAAATSGTFFDIATTVALVDGDDVNFEWDSSASGAGTARVVWVAVTLDAVERISSIGVNFTVPASGFWPPEGDDADTATESAVEVEARASLTARNMQVKVTAHGASGGYDITLRHNGVDSALTVPVAASTTGTFEDNVNSVPLVDGDTYNLSSVKGVGVGTMTCATIGFGLLETVPPAGGGSIVPRTLELLLGKAA